MGFRMVLTLNSDYFPRHGVGTSNPLGVARNETPLEDDRCTEIGISQGGSTFADKSCGETCRKLPLN
jgi:hypothetical protein